MKKLLITLLILSAWLPTIVAADFATPFHATSTTQGEILPNLINGTFPAVVVPYLRATSTTATSTFSGGFNVANGGLIYDFTSGRVGIGTSTPAAKVDSYATSQSYSSEGTGSFVASNLNNRVEIGYDTTLDAGYIWAYRAGTANKPLLLNPSNGNVGIATTSPYAKLSVEGNAVFGGGSGVTAGLFTATSTSGTSTFAGGLSVGTNLYVSPTGNIGIGTTSAFARLSIDTTAIGALDNVFTINTNTRKFFITPDDTNLFGGRMGMSSAHPLVFATSNLDRFTITSAGNVGVGTSSVPVKFTVSKTANTGAFSNAVTDFYQTWDSDTVSQFALGVALNNNTIPNRTAALITNGGYELAFGSGGARHMQINLAGNVGIGTSSPYTKLHVYTSNAGALSVNTDRDDLLLESSGNTGMSIFSGTTATSTIGFGQSNNTVAGAIEFQHSLKRLSFGVNGFASYNAVITTTGLGIGTTSPYAKLSVVGDAVAYAFYATSTSVNIADVTVANTAASTTAFTGATWSKRTYKANTLRPESQICFDGRGYYTTPALAASATVRIVMGTGSATTTLAQKTTTSLSTGASGLGFDLNGCMTIRSIGASASVYADGSIDYGLTTGNAYTDFIRGGAAGTIDTTVDQIFDITVQWDSASSDRSVTITQASVWIK